MNIPAGTGGEKIILVNEGDHSMVQYQRPEEAPITVFRAPNNGIIKDVELLTDDNEAIFATRGVLHVALMCAIGASMKHELLLSE